MAIAKSGAQTDADEATVYVFEDERLFELLVAATQCALDRFDDDVLLAQRQAHILARVRRAVFGELRRAMPDQVAARSPWHFSRALGAYVLKEVRKRQFAAFERRLTEEYGPVEPLTAEEYAGRSSIVNGVRVFRVDPPEVDPPWDESATGNTA